MRARRYLVKPLPPEGPAVLPPDIAHHVGRVLRARAGETLVLFDGHGRECRAEIRRVEARNVHVDVGPARELEDPLPVHLHLAFALPKGPRAEWLFEHGTEVGVGTFWPLETGRSRPARDRRDRWERIVAAAAGQCGRVRLPSVQPPRSLAQLLSEPDLPEERYLATAGAATMGPARGAAAVLLVGPEGGLDEAEQRAARASGFEPRGLGPLTLRAETAALAGAVLLLSEGHHGTGWKDSSAKE